MTPMWWHWTMRAVGIILAAGGAAAVDKADPRGIHCWWQRWRNTRRVRIARRIIARDRWVLDGPRILRAIDPDRGRCRVCGEDHALTLDGRLRRHRCLFGDRELPARIGVAS